MRTWLLAFALMLAGCTADAVPDDQIADDPDLSTGEPEPGPGFAPQTGHDRNETGGLVLEGDMEPCDAGHCIDAEGRNEGDRTLYISDICIEPYADRVEKDGQSIQHGEPMAHCEAFGLRAFVPGETLRFNLSWDGSVWNDGETEPSHGAHEWIVSFRAYEEADGGEAIDLEISFIVVSGQT